MYRNLFSRFLRDQENIQDFRPHFSLLDIDAENYSDINCNAADLQARIAHFLNITHSDRIIFSSSAKKLIENFFELHKKNSSKLKILSTDSEFLNISLDSKQIETSPFDTFENRFIHEIQNGDYDIIYFSHVFYNSGMVIRDLKSIIQAANKKNAHVIIDGTHSFMTIPTNLSSFEDNVNYIFESYKGCAFLYSRSDLKSEFEFNNQFIQFNKAMQAFQNNFHSVENAYSYIQKLQSLFREELLAIDHHYLTEKNILSVDYNYHGDMLVFALPSPVHAEKLLSELKLKNIYVDCVENKIRFKFALYQDESIDFSCLKLSVKNSQYNKN